MTENGPLISPERLVNSLFAVRLLDIRSAVDGGGRDAYQSAHIPGAIHTDYVKDGWRAAKGMATGLLPDPAALSRLFGRLGASPDEHVVIVSAGTSAGDFAAAARVYWTFKCAGHRALSILDGGMAKWRSDPARPVESGYGRTPEPTDYPVTFRAGLRADVATVSAAIVNRDAVLLDSRASGYFRGREKSPQVARAGRLPGALHVDHAQMFDPARHGLRPISELAALFSSIPPAPVVNYCNTGHQAATNWFVLAEVLRRPDVTLYDGSLSEWAEDPSRPVDRDEVEAVR
jgi:thiosulfate/3-mercaptopyruvate sulfurtransferase